MHKTTLSFVIVTALQLDACVVKTTDSSQPESANTPAAASAPSTSAPSSSPTPAAGPTAPAPAATTAPAATAAAPAATSAPPPPFNPPAKPTAPLEDRKIRSDSVSEANMHPGSPIAYWIWHDGAGPEAKWHLRATAPTDKEPHRFSGRVWAEGDLTDMKPVSLEKQQDRLRMDGKDQFAFDFLTGGGIDGADFKVSKVKCVAFHLLVDEKPAPQDIHIGAKEERPKSATFRLCH